MVDERVGGVDEHHRRAAGAAQRRLDGVGERDPSGLTAQHERGECLVGVGERVDVEAAERPERLGCRRALARVGLGATREVDATDIGERTPGGRTQLDDVVGKQQIHKALSTVARPTIMRWISMVPS